MTTSSRFAHAATRIRSWVAVVIVVAAAATSWPALRADIPHVSSGTWVGAGEVGAIPAGTGSVGLPDGRLLVAGGESEGAPSARVAIYDPAAGQWSPGTDLIVARTGHAVALLKDGRVVIAGGTTASGPTFDIEIYDPTMGTSVHGGDMTLPRVDHAAATLRDGRVLIVGGSDGVSDLSGAEIFDPATGLSAGVAVMSTPRLNATATTLLDGHVLVVGGSDGTNDLASAEIFDSASGSFFGTGSMQVARSGHVAVLLPSNNQVLIAGGTATGAALAHAELYADWRDGFSLVPNQPSTARGGAIAGALRPYDLAFVAGGGPTTGEFYGYATVKTDKDDYQPGEIVTISGSGWQPGETVNLRVSEDADTHFDWNLTAIADEQGNIVNREFYPRQDEQFQHLGMRFYVMASGAGWQALNTFTDGAVRVRARISGTNTNLAVTFPVASLKVFTPSTNTTCVGTSTSTFPAAALTTDGGGGNGYVDVPGMTVSTSGGQGSFNAQAPSPVTIGGTTYAFSSWVADSSSQLQGTIVTTGCFNNLGNGQTSITANYVATVNTTTTVASSANPSAFGQAVTFTATVTPASGASNPTGTVQFKVDGADFGTPVSLAPGTGNTSVATSSSTSTLSVAGSPHVITAEYSTTGGFNGSTGTLNQTVNTANTGTSLASSANPSKFGQSVTFTATVARIPAGSGTATGTVTFKEGATTLGTGTLNGSGVATFTTSTLSVASHSITAEYGGDGNFNTSTSSALTQVVQKSDTSTALSSSVNPSTFGQSVTFTATVTATAPGTGTPAGSVEFFDGATSLGTSTLNGSAQATLSTSTLIVGTHSITAKYLGNSNYNESTSSALSQQVQKADTTTSVTSSANPSKFGQSVTFTATVSVVAPGTGTPAGSVEFFDGATSLGTSTLNGSGQASFAASTLTVGTHSITAKYLGNSNYNESTSSALNQEVQKADTTTSVASSANPSKFGQSVTFSATVSVVAPGAGTPAGSLEFFDGATSLGTSTLNGSGQATFTTSTLTVATHSITAKYLGNGNYNESTSSALNQEVQKADTSTVLTSSANPSTFGQSVTFTASVNVVAPGAGTPAGSVEFFDETVSLGTTTLDGSGQATFTTSDLAVGTHPITAQYQGNANFSGSTSGAVNQVVNKGETTTTLVSSTNPSVSGQAVTFTATVSPVAPAAGTPSGTVKFYNGTTEIGSGVLVSGQATFTTSDLAVGTHPITAQYQGNANFNGSTSGAVNQVVNKGETTTTLVSSTNPSVFGQAVTFTATVSPVAPAAGTPSGTVKFYDGATEIGSGTLVSGQAAVTTSALTVGTHTITAQYQGDANFNGSTRASSARWSTKARRPRRWSRRRLPRCSARRSPSRRR